MSTTDIDDDLRFVDHPFRWMVWLLDETLDRVPAWWNGRLHLKGGWGCRMGLYRWWVPPEWWEDAQAVVSSATDPLPPAARPVAHALVWLAVLHGRQSFETWIALLEDLVDDDDPGADRMFEAYYAQRRFQEARP